MWKPLKDPAEEKARRERKRHWHWCRRGNNFSQMPIWRVVAAALELPLFQIQAFADRLEELANDAGNRGLMRGEVSHFDADEFGAATGMSASDAARIFAELEARRWVVDGLVADFYDRNKDEEDETAPLRMRRLRARSRIRKALAQLARGALIAPELRDDFERRLPSVTTMGDAELFGLDAEAQHALSTVTPVTRNARRNAVTVTVEETTSVQARAVDNGTSAVDDETAGHPMGQAAAAEQLAAETAAWLADEGARLVVAHMGESTTRAAMLIERWGRDLGDDKAPLAEILQGTAQRGLAGAKFLVAVEQLVERQRRLNERGEELKIPPGLVSGGKLGAKAPPNTVKPAPSAELLDSPLVKRGRIA